ncbi:MAG TPA: hypothetical protein VMG12_03365, partial [Polyangiaceae bacterium]|nr:hypothetical protein [Polyangiaceae bacterium]
MTFYLDRLVESNRTLLDPPAPSDCASNEAALTDAAPNEVAPNEVAPNEAAREPYASSAGAAPSSDDGIDDDVSVDGPSDFYELVLRDNAGLDRFIVEPELQESGVRHLLGVSVAGTLLYGAMVGLVAQVSGPSAMEWLGRWPVLTLPLAFTGAFLGALAICLPSFYFYTQLSGVDASLRVVTGQALR